METSVPSNDNDQVKSGRDRRNEIRLPPGDSHEMIVWTGQPGIITDESHSGVSLILNDVSGLRIGQSIEITYRGTPASAVIRNVRLMEDGRGGVGLEALI